MDGVGVDRIRDELSGNTMLLDKLEDDIRIFDQVDAFVNLSRGDETVQAVMLHSFTDPSEDASGTHRYAIWDKVAEGIGNLQALSEIIIAGDNVEDDEEEVLIPDWEILARILRRLRQGICLCMQDDALIWDTAALPFFAEAIHGRAMITGFSSGYYFPFHCLDILCSALLTLPALENVAFGPIPG